MFSVTDSVQRTTAYNHRDCQANLTLTYSKLGYIRAFLWLEQRSIAHEAIVLTIALKHIVGLIKKDDDFTKGNTYLIRALDTYIIIGKKGGEKV